MCENRTCHQYNTTTSTTSEYNDNYHNKTDYCFKSTCDQNAIEYNRYTDNDC